MCWVRMAKSCPGGHGEGDWGVQVSTQTPKTLCKVWSCHYSLRGVRQVHAKKGHWDYQPSPPALSETTEIQWDSGQNPSRGTRCVLWGHFARINFNLNNFVWGRVATISLVFLMCFHVFIALKKHLSLQCILCSQSWAVVKKLIRQRSPCGWASRALPGALVIPICLGGIHSFPSKCPLTHHFPFSAIPLLKPDGWGGIALQTG